MKFNVLIEETLSRMVEVEAENEVEAEQIVNTMYLNEEIILTGDDFSDLVIREENTCK